VVTCQFEKITKGQNQLPWVYIRKTMGVSSLVYYIDVCGPLTSSRKPRPGLRSKTSRPH